MRNIQRWAMPLLMVAGLGGCQASDMMDEQDQGAADHPDASSDQNQEDGGAGGNGSDLVGFFAVTSHTYTDGDCDVLGKEVLDSPPLFEVYEEIFGGAPMLFLRACDTTSNCETSSDDFFSAAFLQIQGAGHYAGSAFLSVGGTSCRLIDLATEAEQDGDAVRVEMRTRQLDVELAASECTPDTAQARADEMSCVELRTVNGMRVP